MTSLLAQEMLMKQQQLQPNIAESILEAGCRSSDMIIAPDVLRYLARQFHAWYPVLTLLNRQQVHLTTTDRK